MRVGQTMLPDMGKLQREVAQGASRSASTRLSHSPMWFQLANVWLTTFPVYFLKS